MFRIIFLLTLSSVSLFSFIQAFSENENSISHEELVNLFEHPTNKYRPFVRWWWNGNRVTVQEAKRQIDIMNKAGIGGVEINSIKMRDPYPEGSLDHAPELVWLSQPWVKTVEAVSTYLHEKDMIADIIVGSGWPFGGDFLEPKEQSQRIFLDKSTGLSNTTYTTSIEDIVTRVLQGDNHGRKPSKTDIEFIRLVDADAPERSVNLKVSECLKGNSLSIEVPQGNYDLYVGVHITGYTAVKHGAPGSKGPIVDHYNGQAVAKYLDHMSSEFEKHAEGPLSDYIRATFVDSIELDHSNWTEDLLIEFEKKRGYDLLQLLPFVLDEESPTWSTVFLNDVRRVRYDYSRTLIELFDERFIHTYANWAHENGFGSRIQAYGRETHPLHGSMVPSHPEGETWLWNDPTGERMEIFADSTSVNKYVSSGANLVGNRLRSFEAMTNAVPAFRTTMEDYKLAMDMTILDGLNHPILHGYNYSPLSAGYPGWVQFGCFFNERNPYWPEFKNWTDYSARLGVLMRNSTYQANIAILAPRADEWSKLGMLYQPFPEKAHPWYQYLLPRAFQMVGAGSDFVSEKVIQTSRVQNGKMCYNERQYDLIVLEDIPCLQPETAQWLLEFSKAGGKIVFIGQVPKNGVGFMNQSSNDKVVQKALVAIASEYLVPSPEKPSNHPTSNQRGYPVDYTSLIKTCEDILSKTALKRNVEILQPNQNLSYVYQLTDSSDHVYFFTNLSREEAVEAVLKFPSDRTNPVVYNAMDGSRAETHLNQNELELKLEPLEEFILVFESQAPNSLPELTKEAYSKGEPILLNKPWTVTFVPANGGEPFIRTLQELSDLSLHNDKTISTFGGRVEYDYMLELDADLEDAIIDLGHPNGTSVLRINGALIGSKWHGNHQYRVQGKLKEGANHLSITVSTVLGNDMKSQKDNPVAQRWCWWFDHIRMGLEEQAKVYPIQVNKD